MTKPRRPLLPSLSRLFNLMGAPCAPESAAPALVSAAPRHVLVEAALVAAHPALLETLAQAQTAGHVSRVHLYGGRAPRAIDPAAAQSLSFAQALADPAPGLSAPLRLAPALAVLARASGPVLVLGRGDLQDPYETRTTLNALLYANPGLCVDFAVLHGSRFGLAAPAARAVSAPPGRAPILHYLDDAQALAALLAAPRAGYPATGPLIRGETPPQPKGK